jgi:hypothetical protein
MASLFKKAKEQAPEKKSTAKDKKVRVTVDIPGFFEKLKRQAWLKNEIKSLTAESDILDDELKEVGKDEWCNLYEKNGVNPESIMIESKHNNDTTQFMLLMSDKYIKIDSARAEYLKEQFGEEIVSEKETFTFNADMLNKYGDVISDLIMNSSEIDKADKERIIEANVSYAVATGTIDKLKIYAEKGGCSVTDMISTVKPVCSTKNVEYIQSSSIY